MTNEGFTIATYVRRYSYNTLAYPTAIQKKQPQLMHTKGLTFTSQLNHGRF